MKNFEQMAKDVLQRRDEALAAKAKKKRHMRRISTVAAVCIVTVGVAVGILGASVMSRRDEKSDLPSDLVSSQKPKIGRAHV